MMCWTESVKALPPATPPPRSQEAVNCRPESAPLPSAWGHDAISMTFALYWIDFAPEMEALRAQSQGGEPPTSTHRLAP